jgi:hypothetical protein
MRVPDVYRPRTPVRSLRPKPRISYLVAVVSVAVEDFFFFFIFFLVAVSVLVEVSCAKTTVPESRESPRAAIMIFFIFSDISL